jgi:uncharacterized membrane-anchored protein
MTTASGQLEAARLVITQQAKPREASHAAGDLGAATTRWETHAWGTHTWGTHTPSEEQLLSGQLPQMRNHSTNPWQPGQLVVAVNQPQGDDIADAGRVGRLDARP